MAFIPLGPATTGVTSDLVGDVGGDLRCRVHPVGGVGGGTGGGGVAGAGENTGDSVLGVAMFCHSGIGGDVNVGVSCLGCVR